MTTISSPPLPVTPSIAKARLRFHDPAKEKTALCHNGPSCDFFRRQKCWYAHSDAERRCPGFARTGHCPLPLTTNVPARCPHGLHERGTGQIHPYTLELTPLDRVKTSHGQRPPSSVPDYIKPLLLYPLPLNVAVTIAQRKEDLDNPAKRRHFSLALTSLLRADLATPTTALTRANFRVVIPLLLFADEAQKINDMRRYDVIGADLQQSERDGLWRVTVPSLAEKRPSVLRGDAIVLHDAGLDRVHTGYVHYVNLDHVMVSFDDREAYSNGPYNVYFTMGRTPWRVQHRAVEEVRVFLDGDLAKPLPAGPSVVPAAEQQRINAAVLRRIGPGLTEFQQRFALEALNAPRGLHILWGPPGTGKTTTLVATVRAIAASSPAGRRILVTAPSNAAVDVITERLVAANDGHCNLLRVHALSRAHKDVCDAVKSVSRVNNTGGFEFPDVAEVSRPGQVVLATLSTCARIDSIGGPAFDFIVVDEAGQATEGEMLLPLCLAEPGRTRILLAGDHKQLGPVVPPVLNPYHAARSPLVRLMNCDACKPAVVVLRDNFRSTQAIVDAFNPTYDNLLRCRQVAPAPEHAAYIDCCWAHLRCFTYPANTAVPEPTHRAVAFVHVEGEEARELDSPSWMNLAEASVAVDILKAIDPVRPDDVALLAPYTQQVKKLNGKVHYEYNKATSSRLRAKSVANTVEMFQGKEAPVVIISAVRSKNVAEVEGDLKRHLGFLSQPQRLNVAISRPRALLVVVGNANLLVQDADWRRLLRLLWARGCVRNSSYLHRACDPVPDTAVTLAALRAAAAAAAGGGPVVVPEEVTADEVVYHNNRE